MKRILTVAAALLLVLLGTPVGASASTTNVAKCTNTGASNNLGAGKHLEYFTAYDWWDNTPPGGQIARPVIHSTAGGTGTYSNPITLAVGFCIINGHEYLDYKPGTRFYVPRYEKYFIVEDECGDGSQPQYEPCHRSEYQPSVYHQFDLWVGARQSGATKGEQKMDAITGLHYVYQNPGSGFPVISGAFLP